MIRPSHAKKLKIAPFLLQIENLNFYWKTKISFCSNFRQLRMRLTNFIITLIYAIILSIMVTKFCTRLRRVIIQLENFNTLKLSCLRYRQKFVPIIGTLITKKWHFSFVFFSQKLAFWKNYIYNVNKVFLVWKNKYLYFKTIFALFKKSSEKKQKKCIKKWQRWRAIARVRRVSAQNFSGFEFDSNHSNLLIGSSMVIDQLFLKWSHIRHFSQ